MSESSALEQPLEVERIECSPVQGDKLILRVHGRWLGRRVTPEVRARLVVDADGRRHRFPAIPEPRGGRVALPGAWSASFAVPSWLDSRLEDETSLWLGNVEVPLLPISFAGADRNEEGPMTASDNAHPPPTESDETRAEPQSEHQVAELQEQLSELSAQPQLSGASSRPASRP